MHPVPQMQLGEDAGHVGLDGGLAEEEPLGDLGVGQAAGDQPEHFGLTVGQLAELGWALAGKLAADELLQEPPGDGGRERLPAQGRAPG